MKDTVITAAAKKRELWILACCFIVANLVNVGAVIRYGTSWVELLSQMGYVVCITVVLWVIVGLVRLVAGLFRRKR